jgi:hypothetical protein
MSDQSNTDADPGPAGRRRVLAGRKKLRDSCDRCSDSKVKCERGHPKCRRCLKKGFSCHYSPARRMGKQPASSGMSCINHGNLSRREADRFGTNSLENCDRWNTETSTSTNVWDHATTFPLIETAIPLGRRHGGFRDTLFDTEVGLGNNTGDLLSTPTLSQSATCNSSFTFSGLEFVMKDDAIGWSHNPGRLNDVSSPARDIQMDFDTPDTNTSTSSHTPLLPFHTAYSPHNSNFDASYNGRDCMKLIISTIQGFNDTSSTCRSFSGTTKSFPFQSIDFILEENKAAIELVNSIIKCPCSLNPHLAMLITIILSKILDRYQEVSHSHNQKTTTTSFSDAEERVAELSPFPISRSSLYEETSAVDLPISIGIYRLGSQEKGKIITQLALSELSKVGKCLAAIKKRYHSSKGSEELGRNAIFEGMTLGMEELCPTLTVFLEGKLRAITRAVKNDLKNWANN